MINRISKLFTPEVRHVPVLTMYGHDMGLVRYKNTIFILRKDGDHWLVYSERGLEFRTTMGGSRAAIEAISTGAFQ